MKLKQYAKKILCYILPISILITPLLAFAIMEIENDLYKISISSGDAEADYFRGFDISGFIYNGNDKTQVSSTYGDYGYHTFLNVNGINGPMTGTLTGTIESLDIQKQAMQYTAYDGDGWQNINGINMKMDTSFVQNGRYVNIKYTLTNPTVSNATFSLATAADVQIDGDDQAILTRLNDGKNLKLATDAGLSGQPVQFILYTADVADATPADNMWIGKFLDTTYNEQNNEYYDEYYTDHLFDENYDYPATDGYDSAFCYSWVNRSLAPGETQVFSTYIQVGDQFVEPLPTPTPTPTPTPIPPPTSTPTPTPPPPTPTPTLIPIPTPTHPIVVPSTPNPTPPIVSPTQTPIQNSKIIIKVDDKTVYAGDNITYTATLQDINGLLVEDKQAILDALNLTYYVNSNEAPAIVIAPGQSTISAKLPDTIQLPLLINGTTYDIQILPGTLTVLEKIQPTPTPVLVSANGADAPKTGDFNGWAIIATSLVAIVGLEYIILSRKKENK